MHCAATCCHHWAARLVLPMGQINLAKSIWPNQLYTYAYGNLLCRLLTELEWAVNIRLFATTSPSSKNTTVALEERIVRKVIMSKVSTTLIGKVPHTATAGTPFLVQSPFQPISVQQRDLLKAVKLFLNAITGNKTFSMSRYCKSWGSQARTVPFRHKNTGSKGHREDQWTARSLGSL